MGFSGGVRKRAKATPVLSLLLSSLFPPSLSVLFLLPLSSSLLFLFLLPLSSALSCNTALCPHAGLYPSSLPGTINQQVLLFPLASTLRIAHGPYLLIMVLGSQGCSQQGGD